MVDLMVVPIGLVVGVLMSAPVGPVNILCINRTLRRGFVAGLWTGLGATIGDGVLALVAAFGITAIADMIDEHTVLLQVCGGTVILVFGLRLMIMAPKVRDEAEPPARAPTPPLRIVAATFAMTVTNPGPLLGFAAIFGGIVGHPIVPEGDFAAAGLLVVSIMGGAAVWWAGLCAVVSRIRHRFAPTTLRRINLITGALTMAFGVVILGRLGLMLLG